MSTRRIVFVTLSNYPGGVTRTASEVRAQQNLAALRALGFETTVITPPDPHQRLLDAPAVFIAPWAMAPFVFFHLHCRYRRKVRRVIAQHAADPSTIIFCEHWAALLCAPRHPRVVYSFHDFESGLIPARRLRKNLPVSLKTRAYWRLAVWLERRMLGKAARVISVSATEAEKLRTEWGAVAEYIPTVPPGPLPVPGEFQVGPVRLWFYGGSGATSNKLILDHLAGGLFDQLKAALPAAEFHQAGSYRSYDKEKIEWLERHFQVHGFIDDPAQLFRPGDFCLIPYQQDTGFRTKIPEVCGYGMIPVGYVATFACCPEMRDGENCVMAATPEELVAKLARVCADEALRRKLSAGALTTRRQALSFSALLEKYRHALDFPT